MLGESHQSKGLTLMNGAYVKVEPMVSIFFGAKSRSQPAQPTLITFHSLVEGCRLALHGYVVVSPLIGFEYMHEAQFLDLDGDKDHIDI